MTCDKGAPEQTVALDWPGFGLGRLLVTCELPRKHRGPCRCGGAAWTAAGWVERPLPASPITWAERAP